MVTLERKQGPVKMIVGGWGSSSEALAELELMRKESSTPELLGLATCLQCGSSDGGCERCNPGPR